MLHQTTFILYARITQDLSFLLLTTNDQDCGAGEWLGDDPTGYVQCPNTLDLSLMLIAFCWRFRNSWCDPFKTWQWARRRDSFVVGLPANADQLYIYSHTRSTHSRTCRTHNNTWYLAVSDFAPQPSDACLLTSEQASNCSGQSNRDRKTSTR